METGNEWHFMIVGGAFNGRERVFPGDAHVVVGRSHTANLQLSKLDADVSGKHVEFSVVDGIAQVRNLSKSQPVRVNGVDVPSGKTCAVQTGNTVEMGSRVRIRLDAVPQMRDAMPADTSAIIDATATAATRFYDGSETLDVLTAAMDETTDSSPGAFESPVRPLESMTSATRMPDGITTATRMPESATSATRVPDGITTATRVPEDATFATCVPEDDTSATRVPEVPHPDGFEAETDDAASESGETVEGKTRAGSWEEIMAMKDALERKRKIRRLLISGAFALVAVVLVAVFFLIPNNDEYGMDWPKNADGSDDMRTYSIRNSSGDPILRVDYPGNSNITETPSPDNNGITVVTWYGKRRDVPYFLMLEASSHPDELHLDLMSSVRRWFAKAEASGEGFVFDERMRDELRPKFFEDAYPGSCETKTLYGIRFLEFEYKRTWLDGKMWHGWAHYFRSGDTVYLLRREIPEFYWERGGYRIKIDPNIAIYAAFSNAYWESPGDGKLASKESTAELMGEIRDALSKSRASDWRFVRRSVDTVLARTWRTDQKTRELASSSLRQYRDVLRVYYNEKYNAFVTAKDNREEKKMRRIRLDAQSVFDDPDERYYFLVNNGEVW